MDSHLYTSFLALHTQILFQKTQLGFVNSLMGNANQVKIDLDEAFYFFDYMIHMQPTPPMSCFSILFNALLKNNHSADVISLQKRLNSAGFDVVTYGTLIHSLCRTGHTIVALQLHEQRVNGNSKYGDICKPGVVWYGSMIDGLSKDGYTDKAKELFSEMKGNGIPADAVTFTAFIHGLCCVGDSKEAKSFFIEMLNQGVQTTIVTFGVLLDELCKNKKIDEANRLYKLKIERGVQPNTHTYSILMDGYCLVGRICDVEKFVSMASRVGDARKLLDEMQSVNVTPNSSIFTTFINGLCRNDCVLDALELFHTLENRKFQFTIEIFNCLIDGLSVLTVMGRLREAVLECEEALKVDHVYGRAYQSYIPGFKSCHMQAVDYSVPCSSKDAELVFSGGDGFC
ncbi:hypothetical protein Q3G72_009668 [Acer saccharum]|nr:hypothetical protein Q3G72_009668 [Acer saccharum]